MTTDVRKNGGEVAMINHQQAINTIRMLSVDAIEEANSGHPGLPLGAAPMAYTLWAQHMKHNPRHPEWFNRDRFVLSAGHGSALLYSLLHLFGYDLTLDDLKQFRQWGSRTPGHPEYGHTPGVEATTGPLGQGISSAVGMAMAEAHLAEKFNREGFPVVDHYTYVLCSDGDLMEGVAQEACSLAGHLGLGKLIALYDSNKISLDGELAHSFTEDISQRFTSIGWQVLQVEDGNDTEAISQAIQQAQAETARPTLIEVRTVIGYGSPNRAGTAEAHGKPLGGEELKEVRQFYQWEEKAFHVPAEVKSHFAQLEEGLAKSEEEWQHLLEQYQAAYPQEYQELQRLMAQQLPDGWEKTLPRFEVGESLATRSASGKVLQVLAEQIPELIGGSADLASSNNTEMKKAGVFQAGHYDGRNIWFGVREHGMGAILNGMMLHGGLRAFGATFLVFSDYLRPSIRLAALSNLPVTYVFTHDSIAVGEDGPTHEPIEQIPSLRLIPGLRVIRPADANETTAAWAYALQEQKHPVALILTRQNLPVLPGTAEIDHEAVTRGGYILSDGQGEQPDAILMATGSEVQLAVAAQKQLAEQGIQVRVVSMPCRELFADQEEAYQQKVLPSEVTARVAIEAAHPAGWERYVGDRGAIIGIDHFGASAPGDLLMEKFGFSVENVVKQVQSVLNK